MEASAQKAPTPAAKPGKVSSRTRSERKLAWMLCAPAVIVMLAVTAYPILYAFVLSLQKLDLRFPEQTEFIGFANYGTVLSSELWWLDVWNTLVIMVISVAIELVLGMLIALVIGNIIGSGVFVLPAALAPYGAASLLGWGISLGGALMLALVYARLAQIIPNHGGAYAYARNAFGDRVGFLVAWSYWVCVWSANAAIAVAFAGSLGSVWPAATLTPLRSALVCGTLGFVR